MLQRTEILIDWLQIYGHNVEFTSPIFTFKEKPYGTKHFNQICEIYEHHNKIGEVAFNPRSPILHKKTVILKIENKILYKDDLYYTINKVIAHLKIDIISLTRVDLCCDFPKFMNHQLPNSFIEKFMKNEYLKIGRGQFKVVGTQKKINSYEYLRFGSSTSDVSAYLYNKSKELNNVKNKPYIRENWTWYSDKQKSWQNFDTWRLEFSIKNHNLKFLYPDTGEYVPINIHTILDKNTRQFIFQCLLNHYFEFVVNNGKSRKDRMRKVSTLDILDSPTQLIIPNEGTESGRMQKIFIRMLEEFNCENRQLSKEFEAAKSTIMERYVEKYDLGGWKSAKLNELSKIK